MSQNWTLEIFALLPVAFQKRAIFGALEQMFAEAEWGTLEELLPSLLGARWDETSRARLINLGVRVALRLRNYDLALERYGLFLELETSCGVAAQRAETLMQLAVYLSPLHWVKLHGLWSEMLPLELPPTVQDMLAKIGQWLADAFAKNHNAAAASAIRESMRLYLGGNKRHRIEAWTPELEGF